MAEALDNVPTLSPPVAAAAAATEVGSSG